MARWVLHPRPERITRALLYLCSSTTRGFPAKASRDSIYSGVLVSPSTLRLVQWDQTRILGRRNTGHDYSGGYNLCNHNEDEKTGRTTGWWQLGTTATALTLCEPKMTKEDFVKSIAPMLRQTGFKKDRLTWRHEYPETIAVFNIQGSQWSADFYLNMGIYLKAIGENSAPCENHCHLRSRLNPEGKEVSEVYAELMAWVEKNSTSSGLRKTIETEPYRASMALRMCLTSA